MGAPIRGEDARQETVRTITVISARSGPVNCFFKLWVSGESAKTRINRMNQFDWVLTAPGKLIAITPPHAHWQVEPAVSAGLPPIIVFAAPGFHGVVTGT